MSLTEAKLSILRHVDHGNETGSFIEAVLENNLMEAMGRADPESRSVLFEICSFVYNDVPLGAWGSPEKVEAWRAACQAIKEPANG